ncbi:perforin-1-like [Bombina bombina]|uniref:perforin-1-like n=1 Tax=Bombina bombina TaxID=8345 RepID=UPI00235AC2BA|nr:perforin-1-like [Bombina bombina]
MHILLFLLFFPYSSPTTPPPSLTYSCRTGRITECKKAKFVPGHILLGKGIDIVTMKKTTIPLLELQTYKKKCTLCRNPHMNDEWRKLPKAIDNWEPMSKCTRDIISRISTSHIQVADESSSSVTNDWMVTLQMQKDFKEGSTALAGSQSEEAEFARKKSQNDNYNFLSHKLQCVFYSFHLSENASLTTSFTKALKQLPVTYNQANKAEYINLISKYGTHYITEAKVGGSARETTAVKTCQISLDGLSVEGANECLGMEAEINVKGSTSVNATMKTHECNNFLRKNSYGASFHQKFSERFWEVNGGNVTFDLLSPATNKNGGNAFNAWMTSLKKLPDLVSYSLTPIHQLVRFNGQLKQSLKKALTGYINEKKVTKSCKCSAHSQPRDSHHCTCFCNSNNYLNSDCCPTHKGLANVKVKIEKGTGLYGDYWSKTDAYVKFQFDQIKEQTSTVQDDNNPVWNVPFKMGMIRLSSVLKYKIEVWDEDIFDADDLLGKCERPMRSGTTRETCNLQHGKITYTISATCNDHLKGPFCENYYPIPSQ